MIHYRPHILRLVHRGTAHERGPNFVVLPQGHMVLRRTCELPQYPKRCHSLCLRLVRRRGGGEPRGVLHVGTPAVSSFVAR